MVNTSKVIIKEACECDAIGLALYWVCDMIRAKIEKINDKTWDEAWNCGYNSGCREGRLDGLYDAAVKKYITPEEFNELIKKN